MIHFTIFGGSEVQLNSGGKLIVTIFGGTNVHKPTLAKRIMREKYLLDREKQHQGEHPQPGARWRGQGRVPGTTPRRSHSFILTIFGGVDLKPPTLAEEFMEMRELVASAIVEEQEWDSLVGQLYQIGELEGISSFTLFGGLEESSLPDEEEIKKIASARELGLISNDEERALRSVVGRDPQQVRALLRQTAFTPIA